MLIRIFVTLNEKGGLSTDVQIIQKVLRQVKLRMSDRADWRYDVVDGQTWQPTDGTIATGVSTLRREMGYCKR
jgi:hypothetical protein